MTSQPTHQRPSWLKVSTLRTLLLSAVVGTLVTLLGESGPIDIGKLEEDLRDVFSLSIDSEDGAASFPQRSARKPPLTIERIPVPSRLDSRLRSGHIQL
jgi:hypothetical protein